MELAGILYKTREAHMQQWKKRQHNGGAGWARTINNMKENNPEQYSEYIQNMKGKVSTSVKKHILENGHYWTGKNHSEETKEKMSNSHRGKHDGCLNTQFNTCWVYQPDELMNKKIKKEELDTYLEQGWLKGRKMKFN